MGQYLIDNNVIAHYFSEHFSDEGMNFVAAIVNQTPIISVITEIEALSWVNVDKRKELIVQEFVKDANVIMLDTAIVKECVRIRRNQKIKTPDAIIAASAIVHKLTLLTSDKHFENIKGLQVMDPNKL